MPHSKKQALQTTSFLSSKKPPTSRWASPARTAAAGNCSRSDLKASRTGTRACAQAAQCAIHHSSVGLSKKPEPAAVLSPKREWRETKARCRDRSSVTGRGAVHGLGELWKLLRASMPGMLPAELAALQQRRGPNGSLKRVALHSQCGKAPRFCCKQCDPRSRLPCSLVLSSGNSGGAVTPPPNGEWPSWSTAPPPHPAHTGLCLCHLRVPRPGTHGAVPVPPSLPGPDGAAGALPAPPAKSPA